MLDSDHDSDLRQRLRRLERRNRQLTVGGLALAALFVLPAFASQEDSHVRARSFTLVDGGDRIVGQWLAAPKGLPKLELFGTETKPRLTAMVTADDVVVSLRDHAGIVRCGLAVDNAGRPHVLLSDRKGRSRLHLAVNEMDAGNLIVIGPEGNVVAGIGVSDDGRPWLRPLTGDEAPSQTEKPDAKAKVPGNDGKGDPDPSAEKKLEAPVEALPIRRD